MSATVMETTDPAVGRPLEDSDEIRQIREAVRALCAGYPASTGGKRIGSGSTRRSSCGR